MLPVECIEFMEWVDKLPPKVQEQRRLGGIGAGEATYEIGKRLYHGESRVTCPRCFHYLWKPRFDEIKKGLKECSQ